MERSAYESEFGKIGRLEWIRMNIRGHILHIINNWSMPEWLRLYLMQGLPFHLSPIVKATREDWARFEEWYKANPEKIKWAEENLVSKNHNNLDDTDKDTN